MELEVDMVPVLAHEQGLPDRGRRFGGDGAEAVRALGDHQRRLIVDDSIPGRTGIVHWQRRALRGEQAVDFLIHTQNEGDLVFEILSH